jgi:hypothetical protein
MISSSVKFTIKKFLRHPLYYTGINKQISGDVQEKVMLMGLHIQYDFLPLRMALLNFLWEENSGVKHDDR